MQRSKNSFINICSKTSLSRTLKITSIALFLAPFPKTVLAEEVSTAALLPTLTIEGNALYDAESSEELSGYNIEAATVGTKTPAALKDIPQSITVLTNDYLEDRGFVHLDDAAKATPGLRTLTNDSGRSSIYSRGYEYDDALIDGLPAPISSKYGSLPSLTAFDRIEIMRGPSGLFSSTSELGGIINLVRKRATEDTQASVSAGIGSWGRNHLNADISGSLNEDGSVRSRLVLSQSDSSSQVDESENIDQSIYTTVEFDLDDKTELSVGILHQTKDIAPNNGLPTYADGTLLDVDRSTFIGADWNDFNAENTDLFADLTHQFNNGGRGRIATRASERNVDYEYAYVLSSVDSNGDFSNISADQTEYEEKALALDASYSQPFEIMGNVSEFVVGMDYKHSSSDLSDGYGSLSGSYNIYTFDSSTIDIDDFTFGVSESETKESEQAIYGKLTFRPIEELALIAGARVSNYEIESDTDSGSGTVFTPYAGAVYDLTESHTLYISYSEVFKPQTSTDENGDFIDPRVGKQYEAGIKGSYDSGLLNSRISVFQLTDENRAESVTGETYSEASGKIRIQGFEAELSGQYGPWDVLVGYTYMDTKTLSGSDLSTATLMPQHTFSSWVKYTMSSAGMLDGVAIGAGLSAMSDFSATGRDGVKVTAPSYTVVDTSISKQVNDNLKLSFKINNLLDESYYARVGGTTIFNFYGESRNFMASVDYTF